MTDFTFLELFPSSLLSYCWPDSQELNEQLSKIILEKEQEDLGIQASNVGGWHSKRDLHTWQAPAIATLLKRIQCTCDAMAAKLLGDLLIDYPLGWIIKAWANINRTGQSNKFHTHGRKKSLWSGVYYVDVGADVSLAEFGGRIIFADQNRAESIDHREVGPRYVVDPLPGMMLLFPSALVHRVETYIGPGQRISIAFNVKHEQFLTIASEIDEKTEDERGEDRE